MQNFLKALIQSDAGWIYWSLKQLLVICSSQNPIERLVEITAEGKLNFLYDNTVRALADIIVVYEKIRLVDYE